MKLENLATSILLTLVLGVSVALTARHSSDNVVPQVLPALQKAL